MRASYQQSKRSDQTRQPVVWRERYIELNQTKAAEATARAPPRASVVRTNRDLNQSDGSTGYSEVNDEITTKSTMEERWAPALVEYTVHWDRLLQMVVEQSVELVVLQKS